MPGMERAVAWRRGTVRSGDAWYLEVCTCRGASTNFRLPTKLAVIEAHLLRLPIGSSGLVVGHPTEGASYFDPKNPEPRRVWEDWYPTAWRRLCPDERRAPEASQAMLGRAESGRCSGPRPSPWSAWEAALLAVYLDQGPRYRHRQGHRPATAQDTNDVSYGALGCSTRVPVLLALTTNIRQAGLHAGRRCRSLCPRRK